MNETITVRSVKEYNATQRTKYSEACEKWEPGRGGFPQATFYFFSTSRGLLRETGYVAFGYGAAVWRKTKKAAISAALDYCCRA